MRERKITLEDIAKAADVSKATVSMVINGSPKVSSKTAEKVQGFILDLHFQPNEEARKLARRRWASLPKNLSAPAMDNTMNVSENQGNSIALSGFNQNGFCANIGKTNC